MKKHSKPLDAVQEAESVGSETVSALDTFSKYNSAAIYGAKSTKAIRNEAATIENVDAAYENIEQDIETTVAGMRQVINQMTDVTKFGIDTFVASNGEGYCNLQDELANARSLLQKR